MTIVNSEIIDGPDVELGGQVKGRVKYTFADGREQICRLSARDLASWNAVIDTYQSKLEQSFQRMDAKEGIDDSPIGSNKTASAIQRAVAYVQLALKQTHAYDAYRMMDRMNDWRINNGWTISQVQTQLVNAGLRQSDWDKAIAAYSYLNALTRPSIMQQAAEIQEAWEGYK